jgi:hypothetical protein
MKIMLKRKSKTWLIEEWSIRTSGMNNFIRYFIDKFGYPRVKIDKYMF